MLNDEIKNKNIELKKKHKLIEINLFNLWFESCIVRDSTNFYFKKYILSNIIPTRCLRFILYQTTISSFLKKNRGGE